MPPVIIAAASAGAYVGATALIDGSLGVFVGMLASWGAGMGASAVVGGRRSGADVLQDPDTWLTNEPSNTASIPVVYGTRRVGGTIVFAEVNGADNRYLDVVYAICEGEIEAIDAVYFDNKAVAEVVTAALHPLAFSANSTCGGWVRIKTKLAETGTVTGSFTGTWSALLAWASSTYGGDLEITRSSGTGGTFTISLAPLNLASWTDPRPLMLYMDPRSLENGSSGDIRMTVDVEQRPTAENNWEIIVKLLLLSVDEGSDPFEFSVHMDAMTEGEKQYAGKCEIYRHTGADDQVADAALVVNSEKWTAEHRLAGVAYAYIRYYFEESVFPRGVPVATFDVRGRHLFDPRDESTGYSDNPALAIRDYLTNTRYGRGASAEEIHDDSFIAAANYYDQVVDAETGARRWTCNGAISTDQKALDNMRLLLTCCRSWLVFAGGVYRLIPDAPATPVMDFNVGNIMGAWQINLGDKSVYANRVKAEFYNPDLDYRSDYAPADSPALRVLDRGLMLERTLQLEFTRTKEEAYRHAALELNQSRQPITAQFAALPEGFKCIPGDVVTITHPRPGWEAKKFRVESMALAPQGAVAVTVREYSDAVYDWGENPVFDSAPNTNLPNAGIVLVPGAPQVTEELYSTRAGAGVKTKALVTWPAPFDPYVVEYRLEAMSPTGTSWQVVARVASPEAEVLDIMPGRWLFRVQAVNSLGLKSDHGPITTVDVQGLLAAPTAPTNLALTAHSFLALLSWDASGDLDVRIGGSFRVRHVPAANTTPTWDDGLDIGQSVPGSATQVLLPLLAGTYLVKSVDSSGIESAAAASIATDAPGLWQLVSVGSWSGGPAWTGTHTGTQVQSGALRLQESGGSVTTLDGTWESTGGLTLSAVKRVRLDLDIDASAYNVQDQMDSRVADVDTWPDFDGAVAGAATAIVWVSAYDTANAVWRPWVRLTASDFVAQQFKFRVVLHSSDPAFNVAIAQLTVTAREVA
jgi:hypothetical protein